MTHKSL